MLLTGEGPLLKVFDHQAGELFGAENVFDSQAIHGIAIRHGEVSQSGRNACVTCLVWGGRSISVVRLAIDEELTGFRGLRFDVILEEFLLSDWVLDVAFRLSGTDQQDDATDFGEIVLLNSHNVVFSLQCSRNLEHDISALPKIKELAAGPRSVLYSAHIIWGTPRRLLVAAGTVFGEVLLWSTDVSKLPEGASVSASARLLRTFLGHEGSVFGVRISQPLEGGSAGSLKRILVSCSDDRTIRVWNISDIDIANHPKRLEHKSNPESNDTGFGSSPENADEHSKCCLTKAMGHVSRIWGLRFLSQKPGLWNLLSYGEDSTTQIWQFAEANMAGGTGVHTLVHTSAFAYHSGKNIWASDVIQRQDESRFVATGGADGRIVSYRILSKYSSRSRGDVSCSWTMQKALEYAGTAADPLDFKSSDGHLPARTYEPISRKAIFASLKGKWQLIRHITSKISSYPSGTFEGTALLEERSPSDDAYNAEYLYIEEGFFKTNRDLSFSASRRYVYRYQDLTDQISVWFVKPADGLSVDYQFHILDFRERGSSTILQSGSAIDAGGYHLCVDDDYHVKYRFHAREELTSRWHLQYIVKGPNKDYVADASYQRDSCYVTSSTSQECFVMARKTMKSTGNSGVHRLPHARGLRQDNWKSYSWLNRHSFLVTTEHGNLLVGNVKNESQKSKMTESYLPPTSWEVVAQMDNLRSYSVISSVEGYEIAVLSGNEGTVYLYEHRDRFIGSIAKLKHKISYLFAQEVLQNHEKCTTSSHASPSISILAYCLGSVTAHFWVVNPNPEPLEKQDLSLNLCHEIDLPSTFMVTSSCILLPQGLVILGSRNGAISFHDVLKDTDPVPSSYCVRHVHSEDAVTNIKPLPAQKSTEAFYFLTTGRDGRCAIHYARTCKGASGPSAWKVQTTHVITPPFGPSIEGASFDHASNNLILWGFRSKHFVVWNASTDMETVVVECGGSHRSWAYSPSSSSEGGGNFIWTKASTCNIHTQEQASHWVFQYGSHGREIKALAVSTRVKDGNGVDRRLIATGAEDTAIRIFAYNEVRESSKMDSKCYGIFTKHVTGIQQLRWSPNGHYLFSAAGYEELFAWRIRPIPYFGFGMVYEAVCLPVTESADLRIMGFDIEEIGRETLNEGEEYILSMVYSDSSIRVSFCTIKQLGRR